MSDEVDAANETYDTFLADELDNRSRKQAAPSPCLKGCGRHSFRTKNGVRTKFCRPCWVAEGSVPTSLEVEFAEIDAKKFPVDKDIP
jgi:hypothetical protein